MEELFFRDPEHLRKLFVYMCSQCTALEDPISNVACMFLQGRLHISFGVSGIAFFENGIIFPYFYLSRQQRQYLYTISSAIASNPSHSNPQRYRFCNGCLVLTDYSGKSLDQHLVWRMILGCVATSTKHRGCLRLLANVVIQRVLCRAQHSKDIIARVYEMSDEIFDHENTSPLALTIP
jgi:hypothetical protein